AISSMSPGGVPAEVRLRCEDLLVDVGGLCVAARASDYVRALVASVDGGGPCTAIGHAGGFFFSSRRRHTRLQGDWSSDVCSSDLTTSLASRRPVTPSTAYQTAQPAPHARNSGTGVTRVRR